MSQARADWLRGRGRVLSVEGASRTASDDLRALDNMARVYLGRLPFRARESDIERFFQGYGRITDIAMKRGFAFIEFESKRDAEDAVDELNGRSILGDRCAFAVCGWDLRKLQRVVLMAVTCIGTAHVRALEIASDAVAADHVVAIVVVAGAQGKLAVVLAAAVDLRGGDDPVDDVTPAAQEAAVGRLRRSVGREGAAVLLNAISVHQRALPKRPRAEVRRLRKQEARVDRCHLLMTSEVLSRTASEILLSVLPQKKEELRAALLGIAVIVRHPPVTISLEASALQRTRMDEGSRQKIMGIDHREDRTLAVLEEVNLTAVAA
ncbi:unnamed protein product [Nippostrongylus brasiliensis]|uniref:Probable splicing factor, arginine/serine-rich 5 (inferred by orthology to a C. elegans protein) n=1 Tax=Nippostrongylus brasiliensis TaxID=27835 RepID=A0A0N4Y7F6_NIPBR|nr:unnamed protein product [Nippostrongylus brasiliensis]